MVKDGVVVSTDGTLVPITADTVCIHGDGAHTLTFAQEIRRMLEVEGVALIAYRARSRRRMEEL